MTPMNGAAQSRSDSVVPQQNSVPCCSLQLQFPFSWVSDDVSAVLCTQSSVNSRFLSYSWCVCGGGVEEQMIPDNSTLSTGGGFIFSK